MRERQKHKASSSEHISELRKKYSRRTYTKEGAQRLFHASTLVSGEQLKHTTQSGAIIMRSELIMGKYIKTKTGKRQSK